MNSKATSIVLPTKISFAVWTETAMQKQLFYFKINLLSSFVLVVRLLSPF